MGGTQDHAGRLVRLECFLPPGCTKAPTVTGLVAWKAEFRYRCRKVVATRFGKFEKRGSHHGADRVATNILPPLLSHAAKILRTESYHSDRSEVGFGLGYRATISLPKEPAPNRPGDGPRPAQSPPAPSAPRSPAAHVVKPRHPPPSRPRPDPAPASSPRPRRFWCWRGWRATAWWASIADLSAEFRLGRLAIAARERQRSFLSADGGGVDCAGPRPSPGRSGAGCPVAQPESNLGSVGMVGSRPWNFGA